MLYREKINLYSKLEVQFNSGLVYEVVRSNSDEVIFIDCNFVLRLIIFILLLEYDSTDFPSQQC
jgi:hypothetical protein